MKGMARDLAERIDVDAEVCFGKPRIRASRIWVALLLGFMADGMSHAEILSDYPQLSEDDLRACLAHGARLAAVPVVGEP
jgi:uncharacterized protein (DUF433 family)